jgi:hypothetical protein
LWTQDAEAAQQFGLRWIRGEGTAGLGRKHIHWGGNSGFQAINLAYLWGAKRIILLGFDMQVSPAGDSHWFGEHPKHQGFLNPTKFNSWIRHLETLGRDLSDAGIDVFNATRQTALTCFPLIPIDRIPG